MSEADTPKETEANEPQAEAVQEHPTIGRIKEQFSGKGIKLTGYAGDVMIVVPKDLLHEVLSFLKSDGESRYNFLSDITAVDYLDYPEAQEGRFGVVYNLVSYVHNRRFFVKVYLDPSLDTSGIEPDPALHLPTATDLWSGAEWTEREVFDMFGIRFDGHPDLRRILTWEDFPAHPLRKDYPLIGRGEREDYRVLTRDSA